MEPQPGETAETLAERARLFSWPGPCPVCGGHGPHGRKLVVTPGRGPHARYLCTGCDTTFTRRLHQVARYARWAP